MDKIVLIFYMEVMMIRIAFVLMSMVLFTGVVTGCNDKIYNIDGNKDNEEQIIFSNNEALNEIAKGYINENDVEKEVVIPEGINEIEIDLINSDGNKLPGTLTLPNEGSNFPCIVLVQGSGPSDRDETIFENKPFRDIAWGLAKKGIATYRYDKRTMVYLDELKNDYKLTLEDETVDDAVDAVNMLLKLNNIDNEKIYVLGHSLGGYAIPRIADKLTNAAGYIIMAGNVRGIDEIIKEQYAYLAEYDGNISDDEKLQIDALEQELDKLSNINNLDSKSSVLGAYKEYWKDLKEYKPIEMARTINKPVLVLQGERDYQVTTTEFNLWRGAFGINDSWSFITYPLLNHLMIKGEGKSSPIEYLTQGNVDESVINDIENWIKSY